MIQSTGPAELAAGEADLARAAVRIATCLTLQDLGDAYALGVREVIGSRSIGLYALKEGSPHLLLSRDVASGFLDAYSARSRDGDVLVERAIRKGGAIDGATELGDRLWMSSGSFSLLSRWGFAHCMCGPLFAGGRMIGVAYTAWPSAECYSAGALARFDVLCEAGSLALSRLHRRESREGEPAREGLPPRIREVARLVLRGRSNKEIARELQLSVHTVKEYVGSLCRRVGAQNRTELANKLTAAHADAPPA